MRKPHCNGRTQSRSNSSGPWIWYPFPGRPSLIIGGGIDCLLSSRRVGPLGKVYGLDMTESMIELAKKNAQEANVTNVEFLLGSMEQIPLPDSSVDVIISNCVINLAEDKDVVLQEAYRVLRPGGTFSVSDIVLGRALPEGVQKNLEMWVGCIAGALLEADYIQKLNAAGFTEATIETIKVYSKSDVSPLSDGVNFRSRSLVNWKEDVVKA